MLMIKLSRVGKKKFPIYRVIVTEKTQDPWGKYIDLLGWRNPHTKETVLKKDRIEHWLKQGAQMSDTVHNLFIDEGITTGQKKRCVTISKKRQAKAEGVKAEAEKKAAEAAAKAAPAENAQPAPESK